MSKIFHMLTLVIVISSSSLAVAATETVALNVQGMTCSSCPITVKKALMKVDGVHQVQTSLAKKEAIVTFDDSKVAPGKLIAATTNAGFPPP
jgi:mercuric ion binding protein